jgi:hypothetical protein
MDKEELKLEHLAPYLPYELGINIKETDHDGDIHIVQSKMTCLSVDDNCVVTNHIDCYLDHEDNDHEWHPLLHTLSEYSGSITGGTVRDKLKCRLSVVHQIWALSDKSIHLGEITKECMDVMNRNHIDYNMLIEDGRAIDINTIK